MAASLKTLELEDFKTFYGKHLIGPLQPFTAIVGPNGAGKSNFMDAVAFVLGERLKDLRVSKSSQLINRDRMHSGSESESDSLPPSTSVTAVFALPDGAERAFKRIMCSRGSTFLVAGKTVPWEKYQEELRKVGINAACRNFMVFQGTVESIATQGGHMKSELFEKISGSGALAKKYTHCKNAMEKVEEKLRANLEQRRMVVGNLHDCRLDLKKEKEYKTLEEARDKTKLKLQLFRLYCTKKESKNMEKELQKVEQHLGEVEERMREQTVVLQKKVERQAVAVKDLVTQDGSFLDVEIEYNRKRMEIITAKEVLADRQQKVESCLKLLAKATEGREARLRELKKLEEELTEVEELATKYEEELSQESMRMGTDIQLKEEQLKEYHRLKQEAAQRSVTYQQKLDKLSRQHKTQLDSLANEERKMEEGRAALRRKDDEVKEAMCRAEALKEKLKVFIKVAADKSLTLKEYKERVTTQKKEIESMNNQLEEVTKQLSEAECDVDQAEQQQTKEKLLRILNMLFKGVYDRLGNLCEPIHERYKIAITRVLGKHLDSIVVDTEQTARRCIKYLADKQIGRETFLPLDSLNPSPIRESLRDIQNPRHVRLAFDLVKFEHPYIKVAVLYVTKGTLVCETPEDAMTVANNLLDEHGNKKQLSAVALDGTFFCKSGLVSGGKIELEKKARRWGTMNVLAMRKERNSLLDKLRKAQTIGKEESEMRILESQVMGLKNQVKYTAVEEDKILKHISQVTVEMEKMGKELELCNVTYKVTKVKVADQEAKISQVETEMEKVENEVFASFCKEIRIPSIRFYEKQGLQVMTERANKRLQFEKQKSRLQNQIKYERSRDKDGDVERWRRVVEVQRALVEKAEEEKRKKAKEAEELMKAFAREKAKRVDKAKVVQETDEEVELAQEKARKIGRERAKVEQKVLACKQKMKSLEVERLNILKYCHIKDIDLPLKRGSLKHVALREGAPLSSSSTQFSSSSLETPSSLLNMQGGEAEIEVDFSSLSNALKKVENEEHQKASESLIQLKIRSLEKILSSMHPPSKNTSERMEQATDHMRDMKLQLKEIQRQASDAKNAFEEVKQRRYDLFMDCFNTVAAKIDEVYKGLCQSNQAQALLETSNPEEPYLGSVIYHCIPPGKRCQGMCSLSGGEKSVAALAFLFALHSYKPAPFFLLDEVDAALDPGNIRKLSKNIIQLRQNVAVVVISHRLDLYHKADALFGITYDMVNDYARSKVFSLDLTQYRKDRSWRPSDGEDGGETPTNGRQRQTAQ
ncbi:structural maintenance of chromosomes protein 1A-like [Eriocheir sinensis]|uniref:structural maintenance of chromosomes protein 1A-like n=1 Tax=Eriocheir sinensis TaxID=95602 RepID=UPI0021C8B4E7|nr:structural maintenance of chromosomes protein 1A-like [Eriocheir sinensis]